MVVKREFVPTKSAAAVDSLGRYLVFGGVLEIERLDSLARRVNHAAPGPRAGDAKSFTWGIAHVASVVGAPIYGALGFPFLSRFRLTLDYRTQLLELGESGESSAGLRADETRINFQLAAPQKPLILIPAWLNGRGPYQFALDTGASTTVISSTTARELCIAGSPIPNVTGGGGAIPALAARLGSVTVGTAVANDLAILILEALTTLSNALGTRLDGILGYNFLRGFNRNRRLPTTRAGSQTGVGCGAANPGCSRLLGGSFEPCASLRPRPGAAAPGQPRLESRH